MTRECMCPARNPDCEHPTCPRYPQPGHLRFTYENRGASCRVPAPDPSSDEQAVIDRFDIFRRDRVLTALRDEINRGVTRALTNDTQEIDRGRC